jgi:hypothetical protein
VPSYCGSQQARRRWRPQATRSWARRNRDYERQALTRPRMAYRCRMRMMWRYPDPVRMPCGARIVSLSLRKELTPLRGQKRVFRLFNGPMTPNRRRRR